MKINLKLLGYLLLIIPFLKPYYFTTINSVNAIYNFSQIISVVIIFILYFKHKKISKFIIAVILLEIIYIVSTYYNDGALRESILNAIQTIGFCMIVDYGMKKDCRIFFKAITIVLSIIVIANLISIIMNPNGYWTGINRIWLLGNKNGHLSMILPAIICIYIDSYINNKTSMKLYIFIIIGILSVVLLESATSILGMFILSIYIIFNKIIDKHEKVFNINNYFIAYIVLFFAVIIFRLQDIFSFIIVDLFGKDLTFTGRTDIWNTAIELIKCNPILGYGNMSEIQRIIIFNNQNAVHCHNLLLDIIFQVGILGITVFIYIINIVRKQIKKYNSKVAKFLSWSILVYAIILITEVYSLEKILWVFLIMYNIKLIQSAKEMVVNKK